MTESVNGSVTRTRQTEDVKLLRLLVDRVIDYAIFLLTPDGCVATWNAGARRLKGYSEDEIIGESFERFYPPEARAAGRPTRLLNIARKEGRVEDEGWRVRKDGTQFWADVIITALRDDDGRLLGFAKVTRDLTERRQAEEERARRVAAERAAERLERLQMATAALAIAIRRQHVAEVLADLGSRGVSAAVGVVAVPTPGDQSLQVACVRGAQPIVNVGDRLSRDDPHPLAYAWRTCQPLVLQSREDARDRYPELMPAVEKSPFAAWAVIPLVVDQEVRGVLGLGFDEPRVLDADERGFLLALAEVAAQALDRARLYEAEQSARSEAEAAVHAQDEFLSLASHELRTPVAAVKATAQLARRSIERGSVDGPRTMRHLDTIARSADRLGALVDDLLDVSRLRTGRLRLRLECLDLAGLLREAVDRHAPTATRHQFGLTLADPPMLVDADRLRLEQVLDNLLGNAVKYSPEGGAIRVAARADGSGWLVLVSDEGIGLPAGQETQIFESFGRGSNATAQHIQGLGLGLAISRQLVEAHGGRIWATSPGEGRGTTLSVWLPGSGREAR